MDNWSERKPCLNLPSFSTEANRESRPGLAARLSSALRVAKWFVLCLRHLHKFTRALSKSVNLPDSVGLWRQNNLEMYFFLLLTWYCLDCNKCTATCHVLNCAAASILMFHHQSSCMTVPRKPGNSALLSPQPSQVP